MENSFINNKNIHHVGKYTGGDDNSTTITYYGNPPTTYRKNLDLNNIKNAGKLVRTSFFEKSID
ncbi:hypothetical protein V6615_15245, partial [Oscillospiraceae bacterium PP1C4]